MKFAHDVIVRPIISEKSMDGIADKVYTFEVAIGANKTEIRQAVESVFGVKVDKVNTVNVRGKWKRMGRSEGKTASYKKAMVILKKDSKTIPFFDSLA